MIYAQSFRPDQFTLVNLIAILIGFSGLNFLEVLLLVLSTLLRLIADSPKLSQIFDAHRLAYMNTYSKRAL
jgi:hypothetical protein